MHRFLCNKPYYIYLIYYRLVSYWNTRESRRTYMTHSKRKILSMFLVLIMILSLLASCSRSDKGKNNNNNNNATNTNNANGTGNATNNANATDNANATNNASASNNANATNNANAMGPITGAKEGTYTASAQGYSSTVKATVTIGKDGKVSDIKVDASGETAELGGKAAPTIADQVVKNQSLAVDTVSGATVTSNATITAIKDALSQAGANVGASQNTNNTNNTNNSNNSSNK